MLLQLLCGRRRRRRAILGNDVVHPTIIPQKNEFIEELDEEVPPESTTPYTSRENLQLWLTDEKSRDQFIIYPGWDIEVYWNRMGHLKPELVDYRPCFTQTFVKWSPLGTFLATVHPTGPSVWGGASFFHPLMRYHHPQVELIDFSLGEKYLVSYNRHDQLGVVLKIFDVKTGEVKIDFRGSEHEFATGGTGVVCGVSWPIIRWSGRNDDKYFARIEKNVISIYETNTFTLIDNESLRVENVTDFSWSPADPILALFVPMHASGREPARVSLVQILSKEELCCKSLVGVSDCKMYWQSEGDYLAVMFNQITETKTSKYTGFLLFQIKEQGIPIEVLELENNNIIAFAWEPMGHRFAVIHGVSQSPDISFYSMRSSHNRGRVSKLITLKGMQANSLYWSPTGRFIVLAGLGGFSGQLKFYDVDELEILATEHFMATSIEWNPNGRYLATSGTTADGMRKWVKIWSFCGELLYQISRKKLIQFLWRPRPPSFLSTQNEEEIVKDLKKVKGLKKAKARDVFTLSDEEHFKYDIPQGWDKWWKEWTQLGQLMMRNGETSTEVKESEVKEEKLEVDVEGC